jgi:uncharacterized membrane protein YhiD involved in acid resistance
MRALRTGRLSRRQKRTVLIGSCVAFLLVIIFAWVLPVLEEMDNLDRAIKRESKRLMEVRKLASTLMEINQKEVAVRKLIHQRKSRDFSLASVIETMARQSGVMDQIQAFKPRRSEFSESYEELSVSLKATQLNPSQLVDFFYLIESSEHLLRIRSLQIRTTPKGTGGLDVTMTIFTLVPKEGSS